MFSGPFLKNIIFLPVISLYVRCLFQSFFYLKSTPSLTSIIFLFFVSKLLQDITKFSALLKDTKFSEFSSLQEKQIDELDACLSTQIPRLMEVCILSAFAYGSHLSIFH